MTGTSQDFWTRRKASVAAEAEADTGAVPEAQTGSDERTDADILADLDLPDPDSLEMGDDIKGFMSKAVPEHLRNRALRQLWRLNPVLANVDGLVDYGDDFTDSARVVEGMQTAYQVGKGMFAHVREMARQAEEALDADRAETVEEHTVAAQDEPSAYDDAIATAPPASTALDVSQPDIVPTRRRMQITYASPQEAKA